MLDASLEQGLAALRPLIEADMVERAAAAPEALVEPGLPEAAGRYATEPGPAVGG
jgi:hypothetical protein